MSVLLSHWSHGEVRRIKFMDFWGKIYKYIVLSSAGALKCSWSDMFNLLTVPGFSWPVHLLWGFGLSSTLEIYLQLPYKQLWLLCQTSQAELQIIVPAASALTSNSAVALLSLIDWMRGLGNCCHRNHQATTTAQEQLVFLFWVWNLPSLHALWSPTLVFPELAIEWSSVLLSLCGEESRTPEWQASLAHTSLFEWYLLLLHSARWGVLSLAPGTKSRIQQKTGSAWRRGVQEQEA